MSECPGKSKAKPCPANSQRQSRGMPLIEAAANVVAGYGLAVGRQLLVFPLIRLETTLRQSLQIGALFTAFSLARSYVLRRLFERLGARGFSSTKKGA
ncbi:MAG: hypothetical protein KDK24_21170 [Pseudooceanicola sp.]|nr:hypothetical protein [Pseudooceanicola sp.]